jgi:hypothetical protein
MGSLQMDNIASGKKLSGGSQTIGLARNSEKRRWFELRCFHGVEDMSPYHVAVFDTFSDGLDYLRSVEANNDLYELVACDRIRWDSYLTVAVELIKDAAK